MPPKMPPRKRQDEAFLIRYQFLRADVNLDACIFNNNIKPLIRHFQFVPVPRFRFDPRLRTSPGDPDSGTLATGNPAGNTVKRPQSHTNAAKRPQSHTNFATQGCGLLATTTKWVPGRCIPGFWLKGLILLAVKPLGNMIILVLVFAVLGRFSATVGPRTPSNGSGSKNGPEIT